MATYLFTIRSLICQIWFWPLLLILTGAIYSLEVKLKRSLVSFLPVVKDKKSVWVAAILTFIILTIPFWYLREDAPHSGPDDGVITLQTYASASHRGDSINWTNSMLGGIDRWALPNCHPLSLGRIYALFLKPWELYLLVIGINVISVFIFSFKIQTEFLGMRRWAAYIGTLAAVLTQGYWAGIYPDAHVSNGHGMAVIVAAVYWLTRYHESSKFWIVAVLTGIALSLGSWIPFHNLAPLLITIMIWGSVFWGRRGWLKMIEANALIILTFSILLFPQFLAMKLLYPLTARSGIFRPTVGLAGFYSPLCSFILISTAALGAYLKIFHEKTSQKVLIMFLGFAAVPAAAYVIEIMKLMPAFRWELLYAGNETWAWLGVIYMMDKIQQALSQRFRPAGIFTGLLILWIWWTLILYTWMGSLWFDLDSSYPSGTLRSFTDTSVSSAMKQIDPRPARVVGIDDTNDMHFWGVYQGLEPILGYTPFIDRRLLYFWWFSAMMPSAHGKVSSTGIVTIPIPVKDAHEHLNFPVPLSAVINLDALKLTNVDWVVSHHPLFPSPDLVPVLAQPGDIEACTNRVMAPMRINFGDVVDYWKYTGCLLKDYRYERPLYVYHLKDSLPRAFIAKNVQPWPLGQPPILSQDQLARAAQKTAFVDYMQLQYSNQNILGQVDIDTYQSDYMHLKISTGRDSLLVLTTTLNPYWRLLVDGQKTPFFDVNGFQTGFWVHPQNTQAELIYCPPYRPAVHPYCSRTFR